MSFSFSSLSLYNTCPFAYKLAYIDKVKPVRSTALVKGSNVHSILEKYPEIQEKEYKYNEKEIAYHQKKYKENIKVLCPVGMLCGLMLSIILM